MKVLAVDDSLSILQLIKDTLSLENIYVETAMNGAEALDKYAKLRPDIVTLDVSMPIMDGYETLSKILNYDKNARIIMLTVEEHWPLVERCLSRGAIGFIAKPFKIEELINTIRDPWHYDDKNVVTLFSLASNKIQNSLQKIYGDNLFMKLDKIKLTTSQSHTISSGNTRVVAVKQVTEEPQLQLSPSSLCFVSEITGQMRGLILSHVDKEHLNYFMRKNRYLRIDDVDAPQEFFNIINSKIFSTISDMSGLIMNFEVTKQYDVSCIQPFGQSIKVNYTLVSKDFHIPIETQVWTDSPLVLKRRF